jgi:hypothetical protein
MTLRVLVGSAPRDDFSHLSLAQQVISSGCGQLHNPPSVEAIRITLRLLLEEDFAVGTTAIISLNEMNPRWRMTSASATIRKPRAGFGTKPSSVGRMERR